MEAAERDCDSVHPLHRLRDYLQEGRHQQSTSRTSRLSLYDDGDSVLDRVDVCHLRQEVHPGVRPEFNPEVRLHLDWEHSAYSLYQAGEAD